MACSFIPAHQELALKEQLFDARFLDCGTHKVLYLLTCSPAYCDLWQFSLHCTKYDRHGYKARQRIFVVTEKVNCWCE